MTTTHDIVQKLWRLCDVLRDDGITYHQYVTELTWLLFLKMEQETRDQRRRYALPDGYRWEDLVSLTGNDQQIFYRELLLHLGTKAEGIVLAIYADAATSIRKPVTLGKLVADIDQLDWYDAKQEGLGDLYEGLLQKNAGEKKSGAGQYFTPRPLIDCMVALIKPQPGEVIQDPAAGTGGFLNAADRYMREETDDYTHHSVTERLHDFLENQAFVGVELVPEAHRLMLMNLMLHGVQGRFDRGDSLSGLGANLPKADVILTNPPFGTKKGGGGPTRDDFTFPTSNKQLAFLQHIYRGLKPGGRAAVVLPDNVLFEENTGTKIRQDLMGKCDLHTILRLPTGIFYAQGVKTNVLFFRRGKKDEGSTKAVWIYDMRNNMPSFGKRTPLTRAHFAEFEKAFGKKSDGKSRRKDEGEEGRFRKFTREEIEKRGDNLDISWLRDEDAQSHEDLGEPDEIAAEIIGHLQTAMAELEALSELLATPGVGEEAAE